MRSADRLVLVLSLVGLAAAPAAAQVVGPAPGSGIISGEAARQKARELGLSIRTESADGNVRELHSFVNGQPQYLTTFNVASAVTISSDDVWPGGSAGLNLTGRGVRLGIWDAGAVRHTHQEFGGRTVQRDGATVMNSHATHVAGTMIARGAVAAARGMASGALLDCYDWTNDVTEMRDAARNGLRIANISYGFMTGWELNRLTNIWSWYGDVSVSPTEDYRFGFYSTNARDFDKVTFDYPHCLIVKSAGNDRNHAGPGPNEWHYAWSNNAWTWNKTTRPADGHPAGFDTLGEGSTAKNILTVGAVEDIAGGYSAPAGVVLTAFSAFGPTDDGRIKPDIVANGHRLLSAIGNGDASYDSYSGTSMSTPSVSGSLALLAQMRSITSLPALSAASLKALVIHTADEAGTSPGPDYRFGWGLMNTRRAAEVIKEDAMIPSRITEMVIHNGQTITIPLTTTNSNAIKATICWTDAPGAVPTISVDPTQRNLVNDLDVRIVAPTSIGWPIVYYPWVLDPASPANAATKGDNSRDNVEQVSAMVSPVARYSLVITHKGSLSARSQPFSIVLTGATF